MVRFVRTSLSTAVAALVLAGCAARRVEAPVAIAIAPPAPPAKPPGLPDRIDVPPVGADGEYLTLNHGLLPPDAVWHVRSALNVAALGCRGEQETAIIAAYNAMLRAQRAPLADALRAVQARYKAERGTGWQEQQDTHMTRVYNFFAQPPAQQRFCAVAAAVATEADAVPPADFTAFAVVALVRLEAPFTDVYRAYDGYRRELAAWQARYGTGTDARPPQLGYEDMRALIGWDGPVRTASR